MSDLKPSEPRYGWAGIHIKGEPAHAYDDDQPENHRQRVTNLGVLTTACGAEIHSIRTVVDYYPPISWETRPAHIRTCEQCMAMMCWPR